MTKKRQGDAGSSDLRRGRGINEDVEPLCTGMTLRAHVASQTDDHAVLGQEDVLQE